MSYDEFRSPPRFALNCRQWADGINAQRHGGVANARRAAIRGDDAERQRRIRRYCAEHHVSEREAERELFDDDEVTDRPK